MASWTLSKFLSQEIVPYLSALGFSRVGTEFHIESPEEVIGWIDFRNYKLQSGTVTFRADIECTLPTLLSERLARKPKGAQTRFAALGVMSYRLRVPQGYKSLAVNPIMASADDLFSFYDDGTHVSECFEAFRDSWEHGAWPWLSQRLTLDGMAKAPRAPIQEIETMRERAQRPS